MKFIKKPVKLMGAQMEIKEMREYFERVQNQHIGIRMEGMINPHSDAIIKTYQFVIDKLKEWESQE